MNKKILLVGLAIVAVILVLWFALIGILNSDALGDALLAQASRATGISLSAEEFDLGFFSGLEMTGVTAEGESSAGQYKIELEELVFRHRFWPLLSGTLAVDKILVNRPDVLFISRKTASTSTELDSEPIIRDDSENVGFRLEVNEIRLTDGRIQVQSEQESLEEGLRIEGLSITLENIGFDPTLQNPVQRISGSGTISADSILLGKMPIRDLRSDLVVREGVADLTQVDFSMDQGDLQSSLRADLARVPFEYRFSVQADPINVNQIVGLGRDGSLGPGRLEMEGEGQGPESADLKADGFLHLDNGQLPSHPILQKAQAVVGIQDLIGGQYEATDAQFQVENNKVMVDGFSLETARAGLNIAGWVALEGPLEMKIGLRTPREGLSIPKVPPVALDIMADDQGWVTVPLLVTGTLEDPRVIPDLDSLQDQGVEGATRQLRNLIRGRRPR